MNIKALIIATVLLVSWLSGFAAQAAQPTLAVLDFRNDTAVAWWRHGVGRELGAMLSNELANTEKFRVVERQKLGAVLQEQDLAASGRIAPGTGAQIGKLVGADYLVTATVSAYEEDVQDSGGGLRYKGFSLGGKKQQAYLAVDLRIVDSTSGEIAYSRTVEARSSGGGVKLGINRFGFGGALEKEKKTPAGKAIRAMVIEASDYLVCALVIQGNCMNQFDAKEEQRRSKLRDTIRLD